MADDVRRKRRSSEKTPGNQGDSRPLGSSPNRKITKVAKPTFGKFNIRTASDVDLMQSGNFPFYSPQLSTDYFELPRSIQERREWYRHWYENDEIISRAIDIHCDLPLSKVTLGLPKCQDREKANYIWRYFMRICDHLRLFERLQEIAHEYWLQGNCFIFLEEDTEGLEDEYPVPEYLEKEDMPEGTTFEDEDDAIADYLDDNFSGGENEIDEELKSDFEEVQQNIEEFVDGAIEEKPSNNSEQKEKQDKINKLYKKWNFKNIDYKGWKRIIVLPPDQVLLESFDFTDEVKISLQPSDSMRKLIETGDSNEDVSEILDNIPPAILERVQSQEPIPLDTDPLTGSHVYHLSNRKSQYEDFGLSILQRCLRTLLYRDKLRQAQTMIADRALTPKHIVWSDTLSDFQVDELREHVDLALVDPDYAIVANYQINWDQISARERLLDLGSEYEETEKRLLVGLGVTKELLTGEGTYGGNRITLEVMNTIYLNFREKLKFWVENYVFKPICFKKGFVEVDPVDGKINPIVPSLKFTRLAIRDNADLYEQLFSLYQKGSLPVEFILDLWNIDSDDVKEKLEQDLFTVNDSRFNDLISRLYDGSAEQVVQSSNIVEILRENLGLEEVEQKAEGEGGELGRFAFDKTASVDSPEPSNFLDFLAKKFSKEFQEYRTIQDKEYQEFLEYKKNAKKKEEED